MSEQKGYQPSPEEIQAAEGRMTAEDWDLTERREKGQRDFEQRTRAGFDELKEIIARNDETKNLGNRREFGRLLSETIYLQHGEDEAEVNEGILLLSILFNR